MLHIIPFNIYQNPQRRECYYYFTDEKIELRAGHQFAQSLPAHQEQLWDPLQAHLATDIILIPLTSASPSIQRCLCSLQLSFPSLDGLPWAAFLGLATEGPLDYAHLEQGSAMLKSKD